ncbi:MAG: 50S ribosomal protein L18 [Candidatus Berkelbacteria bacterium]|nr:50S ribosomal protein L18 [Candidatus Berkelbacteria bacterium]
MKKVYSRKNSIRNKIKAKSTLPRFCVFRSNSEISAQVIGQDGKILASASSLKIKDKKSKVEIAEVVGKNIAIAAIKNKTQSVVFDRSGYKYHGRVAALAKGARSGGLKF